MGVVPPDVVLDDAEAVALEADSPTFELDSDRLPMPASRPPQASAPSVITASQTERHASTVALARRAAR